VACRGCSDKRFLIIYNVYKNSFLRNNSTSLADTPVRKYKLTDATTVNRNIHSQL